MVTTLSMFVAVLVMGATTAQVSGVPKGAAVVGGDQANLVPPEVSVDITERQLMGMKSKKKDKKKDKKKSKSASSIADRCVPLFEAYEIQEFKDSKSSKKGRGGNRRLRRKLLDKGLEVEFDEEDFDEQEEEIDTEGMDERELQWRKKNKRNRKNKRRKKNKNKRKKNKRKKSASLNLPVSQKIP